MSRWTKLLITLLVATFGWMSAPLAMAQPGATHDGGIATAGDPCHLSGDYTMADGTTWNAYVAQQRAKQLPLFRWQDAVGTSHSYAAPMFDSFGATIPNLGTALDRDWAQPMMMGAGTSLYSVTADLAIGVANFCPLHQFGGQVDRVAAGVGNMVLQSPLVLWSVLVTIGALLFRRARNGSFPFSVVLRKLLIIALLIVMVGYPGGKFGAHATAGGDGLGGYSPGFLSPGWFMVTVDRGTSMAAGAMVDAVVKVQEDARGKDKAEQDVLHCTNYVNSMHRSFLQSNRTSLDIVSHMVSGLWERSGLQAFKAAQFGQTEHAEYVYCRYLDAMATGIKFNGTQGIPGIEVPDSAPGSVVDYVLVRDGYRGVWGVKQVFFYQQPSITRPASGVTKTPIADNGEYGNAVLTAWAACKLNSASAPWDQPSSWSIRSKNGLLPKAGVEAGDDALKKACATLLGSTDPDVYQKTYGIAEGGSPDPKLQEAIDLFKWSSKRSDLLDGTSGGQFQAVMQGHDHQGGAALSLVFLVGAVATFVTIGGLSLGLLIAKVSVLILGVGLILAVIMALFGSSGERRLFSVARQYLGLSIFVFGYSFLLAMLTWLASLIASMFSGADLGSAMAVALSPVGAALAIKMLFKQIGMPNPMSIKGGLAYAQAASNLSSDGLGAGIANRTAGYGERFKARVRQQASTKAKATGSAALHGGATAVGALLGTKAAHEADYKRDRERQRQTGDSSLRDTDGGTSALDGQQSPPRRGAGAETALLTGAGGSAKRGAVASEEALADGAATPDGQHEGMFTPREPENVLTPREQLEADRLAVAAALEENAPNIEPDSVEAQAFAAENAQRVLDERQRQLDNEDSKLRRLGRGVASVWHQRGKALPYALGAGLAATGVAAAAGAAVAMPAAAYLGYRALRSGDKKRVLQGAVIGGGAALGAVGAAAGAGAVGVGKVMARRRQQRSDVDQRQRRYDEYNTRALIGQGNVILEARQKMVPVVESGGAPVRPGETERAAQVSLSDAQFEAYSTSTATTRPMPSGTFEATAKATPDQERELERFKDGLDHEAQPRLEAAFVGHEPTEVVMTVAQQQELARLQTDLDREGQVQLNAAAAASEPTEVVMTDAQQQEMARLQAELNRQGQQQFQSEVAGWGLSSAQMAAAKEQIRDAHERQVAAVERDPEPFTRATEPEQGLSEAQMQEAREQMRTTHARQVEAALAQQSDAVAEPAQGFTASEMDQTKDRLRADHERQMDALVDDAKHNAETKAKWTFKSRDDSDQ